MRWQNHVGLDVGSANIKLVQVAPAAAGRFRLLALGQVETPAFTSAIEWDQARSEAIKKLFADTRVSTRQVVISLPESLVYTRVIETPVMSEADLASTIRFQAEQYIPVALTDVVLKHQVLFGAGQDAKEAKMSVLLVAAPNDILSRYSLMLSKAGLEIVAVETEILAVARAIFNNDETMPTTLLVHLGAEATTLAIFSNGRLMLVQSVATGGTAIVRSVSTQLGLDSHQAEEYVKSYGLDQTKLDGKVSVAVKPVVELVAGEVKRAAAYYSSRGSVDPIKRVVLTGGMALLPELVQYFNEAVSFEVQLGNPFASVDLSEAQKSEIAEKAPIYATGVGLATKPL